MMWRVGVFGVVLCTVFAAQAFDGKVLLESDVEPGRMMANYLSAQAAEAFDARRAAYEGLKTPEQVRAYQAGMKAQFVESLGGFPDRTPLNARVTDTLEREGYRIEKVLFESRPGFHVTGLMYLPDGEPPFPGVLVPCGHSTNGKASEAYQRACVLMALQGLAVFCYDPIGQGERYQILEDGKPRVGPTTEHTFVGVGSTLVGESAATVRIWDGLRAMDYLASRPDVDATRLGCTGNSGGGTLTAYLMALDERIVCAAPSCYITSLERLIATIGAQDAEQDIYGQIAYGMEHADYLMMRAPLPTLICAATGDFFDIEGTWDTFRQAKRIFTRLGYAERVDIIESDASHGFNQPLREAAAHWMARWLLGRDAHVVEPEFPVLSDAEAQVTPDGQVLLLDGARSIFELNAERADALAAARPELAPDALRAEVRAIAGIRPVGLLPEPGVQVRDTIARDGYRIETLVVRPEPGIVLPALRFVPDGEVVGTVLYADGAGKAAALAEDGPVAGWLAEGKAVLAADLRGLGETADSTVTGAWATNFGPEWRNYFLAYMLGRSYLGMRAEDVLSLAQVAAGDGPVELVGVGLAGPAALHAAALEPELFAAVRIERSIPDWASVVETPITQRQLENAVHGALQAYDLPDLVQLYEAATGHSLGVANPASPSA